MRRKVELITSFFYLGHSPFMPGTMGSLGGLILYFIVRNNDILFAFSILFLFTLGVLFAGEAEKVYRRKDPAMIVIDEACGMLLALFFVPFSLYSVILGFFLFRIFDILKPPPARRLEKLTGSLGIMFDDIVAALYTNIILQIVFRVIRVN
ncbi:MAG: phosphatidylglycerophosphatase A [Candidatus Omnitrophica bacterium]|nr:phosphatidylglycerophosphatase A [Candidatus Omnitrophota bacterium]MBU0880636.1 phosphatidylglycerophosphatase A [Candidatus Omnitrophota bacterium]MBU0895153.1 phosphatidylglycerophosphatase A [Candidatus Omnitrophota bacterium]MBU1037554.1 phosphatidylglycerophosphatase A [Candidatus Omnitrophota bacterium]MBU1809341.1 phosphatidylglycerophosphatase A [Candidatus Omnitrophota bacterium]